RLRGDPAGEAADHPGVPVRALRRAGDPDPAVPARRPASAAAARISAGPQGDAVMSAPLLACAALTRRFGGLVALDRIDFAVAEGEIVGLIGPNGSGKTTLFNVVTGIYAPDGGSIAFAGADISGARPQAVYRAGIARTFQRSRMCLPLSVFDNVMVGNHK